MSTGRIAQMLRSILSAVGRALAWTAKTAAEIAMAPVHGVLQFLFPALYEPMPPVEWEVNDDSLPIDDFDPFSKSAEVQHAREQETLRVITWAADAAYSGGELPLPQSWLASLSNDELHTLVAAGKEGVYAHLHFNMKIPGVPGVDEKGHRLAEPVASLPWDWDPTVSSGGFAVAAFARAG
jgi:hypothetical protein